jgi:hypothetical protein
MKEKKYLYIAIPLFFVVTALGAYILLTMNLRLNVYDGRPYVICGIWLASLLLCIGFYSPNHFVESFVILFTVLAVTCCSLAQHAKLPWIPLAGSLAGAFFFASLIVWYFVSLGSLDRWITPIIYEKAKGDLSQVTEKDPPVVFWLNDVFLAFHEDGTKSEYIHQIITMPNTLRVSDYEHTAVVHPVGAAVVRKIQAVHYGADGKRKKVKITNLPPAPCETPNGMETWTGSSVQFLNLVAGDTVDLTYIRDFVKPPVQGKFNWDAIFVHYQPYCAQRRITIAIHRNVKSQVVPHNFELQPKYWQESKRNQSWQRAEYDYYQWELANLETYKEEYSQPSVRDSEAWIDVSTCPSWDPIVDWLRKHLITPVKDVKDVKSILAKIVTDNMTLRDKAKACYDYCINQITYGRESSLSFSDNAQSGDKVAQVMRGDCKDQTSLLMALYTDLGISSEAAAVNLSDGGKTPFLPSQRFDHAILRCKLGEEYLWADPTAKHVVFGVIPQELEGSPALLISAN